jgi:precorrin-4/cobalt-precorrin-4 C11-methyltransferase
MIYFIGAGPGDSDLITVKGAQILGQCSVAIYAGSLVNPEILKYAPEDCAIYDSSGMTLEEVLGIMQDAHLQGKDVARVHTGDPSIYGAIREQMEELEKLQIPFRFEGARLRHCHNL